MDFALKSILLVSGITAVSCVTYPVTRIIRDGTSPQSVTLPCWEVSSDQQVIVWVTNENHVVGPDGPASSSSRYLINSDGSLTIQNITKTDSGMHQCIANRSFELSLLGSELEVIDVSYLPEIDDIEANVIRSVIAGGCMALFLLTTCGVCQYRWTPERKFRSSGGSSDCQTTTIMPDSSSSLEMTNLALDISEENQTTFIAEKK